GWPDQKWAPYLLSPSPALIRFALWRPRMRAGTARQWWPALVTYLMPAESSRSMRRPTEPIRSFARAAPARRRQLAPSPRHCRLLPALVRRGGHRSDPPPPNRPDSPPPAPKYRR